LSTVGSSERQGISTIKLCIGKAGSVWAAAQIPI